MDNEYFDNYTVADNLPEEKKLIALKFASLSKVCFDVLENEKGRELRALISELVLQQPVQGSLNENYERACVYTEGMKAAFRQIFTWSDMFKAQLDADAKNQAQLNPEN